MDKDPKKAEMLLVKAVIDKSGATSPIDHLNALKIPPSYAKLMRLHLKKPLLRPKKLAINQERKSFTVGPRLAHKTCSPLENHITECLLNDESDGNEKSHLPVPSNYKNPIVIKAAEKSIPFFASIDSVIQSFNKINTMMETTASIMQISYETVLDAADNYVAIKKFWLKLYSAMASYKLVRWFLNKMNCLLKLVTGNKEVCANENIFTSTSFSTQAETASRQNNWPVLIFAGLLFTVPIVSYKLINLIAPATKDISKKIKKTDLLVKANHNWTPGKKHPCGLPLVKGQKYCSHAFPIMGEYNKEWLMVSDVNGNSGYAPKNLLTQVNRKNEIIPIGAKSLQVKPTS